MTAFHVPGWTKKALVLAGASLLLAGVLYASSNLTSLSKDQIAALGFGWKVLGGFGAIGALISGWTFQVYFARYQSTLRKEADAHQAEVQGSQARENIEVQNLADTSREIKIRAFELSEQRAAARRAANELRKPVLLALAKAIQKDVAALTDLAEASPFLRADTIRQMIESASACQNSVKTSFNAVCESLVIVEDAFTNTHKAFLAKGFDILSDAGAIRPADYASPGLNQDAIVERQSNLLKARMKRHVARLNVLAGLFGAMLEREMDLGRFTKIRLEIDRNRHARTLVMLEARRRRRRDSGVRD